MRRKHMAELISSVISEPAKTNTARHFSKPCVGKRGVMDGTVD